MQKALDIMSEQPKSIFTDLPLIHPKNPFPYRNETEYYAWSKFWVKKAMELLEAGNREEWLAWNDTCLEKYRADHNE